MKTIATIALALLMCCSAFASSVVCDDLGVAGVACKTTIGNRTVYTIQYSGDSFDSVFTVTRAKYLAAFAKKHKYDCMEAQSGLSSFMPENCPPAPKSSKAECLKDYAVHPWYVVKEDGAQVIDANAACKETK